MPGSNLRGDRRTKFGFVRFFSMEEVDEALRRQSECYIGGRALIVKQAKERKVRGNQREGNEEGKFRVLPNRMRGSKSYAQILKEPFIEITTIQSNEQGGSSGKATSATIKGIVGELRGIKSMTDIRNCFQDRNMDCKIRPLGGLSILFSFREENDLQELLMEHGDVFGRNCYCFYVCPNDYVCTSKLGWVELRGVPLKVWERDFFKDVGNTLGNFVMVDNSTEDQSKFDIARILITCNIFTKIPSSLVVSLAGKEYRISIRFSETKLSGFVPASRKGSKSMVVGEEFSGRQEQVVVAGLESSGRRNPTVGDQWKGSNK